nr:immunoglobulin heavy chain junction region [Macaca mulatta]MOW20805.1 immunoglobulin heavy chain junction region [Macaca mulatta]MOW20844.1 immunoglobulin heavy chain junction region [Macaca mulatta]MOW22173.1 immunoglobulin heavy chain junction region [Macaca mulatta]
CASISYGSAYAPLYYFDIW